MSGTANSFMFDLTRKRKYDDGSGEPAAECESDSDSDCACVAPDSDDDDDSLIGLPIVEKHMPFSTSFDTGLSIKPNILHVEKHMPFSTSCETGISIKPNILHVAKHMPFSTSCDTGKSIKQDPVCVGGTSSVNRSNVTARLPPVTKPSNTSWATKYLTAPVEPQNSTTADQGNGKEATKVKKDIEISTGSLKSANTVPSKKSKTVWIFGDSWIHWARKYAQIRREAFNLGIINMKIYWFPQEEMRWSSLLSAIRNVDGVPDADVVVIHCGAEDLCYLSRYDLTSAMKKDIQIIKSMFPESQVVFSCIPQRKVWVTTSALGTSIGRARRNINKFLAEFLGEHGMFHIRHDNIMKDAKLFRADGVQLSDMGNKNFLQNIREALKELP